MLLRVMVGALLVAASTFASAAVLPNSLFYSGVGYVTQGKTGYVASPNYQFNVYTFGTRGDLLIDIFKAPYDPFTRSETFELELSAPGSEAFHVGRYDNAVRAAFSGPAAGLAYSMDSRGDNTLTGTFDILDIAYDATGALSTLAVDFLQNDEDGRVGHTRGSLRYQSSIATNFTTPEPSTAAVLLLGAITAGFARSRNSRAGARASSTR